MLKEEQLYEKRFIELSRTAFHRNIVTFTDFLNLNELNILHTIPKDELYCNYVTFGGYDTAERQMAAFVPDALSLRTEKYPISVLKIAPASAKFAETLTHRDYLGAILNLGIERSMTGDILIEDKKALIFVQEKMADYIKDSLTRVRHTNITIDKADIENLDYHQKTEVIKGTVASVRLDSLLSIAFSHSRTKLTGLIEGGKVFVNGRLMTTNAYQVKENDIISVRGMGKFKFHESLGKSKKNRIYVEIYKYI